MILQSEKLLSANYIIIIFAHIDHRNHIMHVIAVIYMCANICS